MDISLGDTLKNLNLRTVDVVGVLAGSWLVYKVMQTVRVRARTTKLPGPPAKSWLFGVSKEVFDNDAGEIFENWTKEYGDVFQIPGPLGQRRTVLTDPKAVSHYFGKGAQIYIKTSFVKQFIANVLGKGVLWAEGEDHKRQRRSLNPAFTIAAIRDLVHIFYESAYKVKTVWDVELAEGKGEAVINVQKWMNCVSLDTIGLAAFGHDFGALRGVYGDVEEAFDALGHAQPQGADVVLSLLGPLFPALLKLPTKRQNLLSRLNTAMQGVAKGLLERTHKDLEADTFSSSSRSIMGILIRAEAAEGKVSMTEEEIIAQMKTLMLAGYETTSISLTWALIELSRNPEKQDRLRKDLSEFEDDDPSYDQLMNGLPYLNGVLHEILRLHGPVQQNNRITATEDVIPLSEPVKTTSGKVIDSVTVGTGATVMVPLRALGRSAAIWGSDAKEFKPERWLDDEAHLASRAKEFQGYHHIMSFIDGPRICLGRVFAVAEFKAVLSVLIRNYVFELRDGPETKIELVTGILPRPKIAGEDGYAVPLRIRRVES